MISHMAGMVEIRERVLDIVKDAAALACFCDPDRPCLGCRARTVLDFLTTAGFRLKRWRNPPEPPLSVVHVAGDVIDCREYRRSCPGFIVDRRQTCTECGRELVRGRWALFFQPGDLVSILLPRPGSQLAGVPLHARGAPGEVHCAGRRPTTADVELVEHAN